MDTPSTPMYGGFLHVYAPVPGEGAEERYQRLRWHVEQALDAAPVFRRVIERPPLHVDHGWFVEGVDLDLDYHVRRHALPAPGSDAELNALYARIAVQPMDITRPLWEIHVIDGLDAIEGAPRHSFALFIKVHHAGVDGKSAAEMTAALHRTSPERNRIRRLPAYSAHPIEPESSLGEALLGGAKRLAGLNAKLRQTLFNNLPALGSSLSKRLVTDLWSEKKPSPDKLSVPQTIFNVEVDADRCYTHLSLPLDEIRHLRQQVPESTVNDVFLAVVGGGLRRYLQHHGALPAKSLVAGVTVDVRPEHEKGKGGNYVALIRVPVGTDTEKADVRLKRIFADTTHAKSSRRTAAGANTQRRGANWPDVIPAPLLWVLGSANQLRVTARMKPLVNLGATNVPGPREVLYLDGARMVDFNGTPPMFHGVALVINTTSYDGALRISVYSCRKVMPDPERMRTYLLESFAELKRAFRKGARAPGARRPRR
jgi:WS/DGAT/MGAT family acyltransferase